VPLRVEPELHERRVGILQGVPTKPPHPLWIETTRHWQAGDTAFATAGAESFDNIRMRVLPVWQRLTADFADRSLIMVAHGVVIQVLLLNVLSGHSPADWQRLGSMRNLGITELLGEGDSWRALRVNEVPAEVSALM